MKWENGLSVSVFCLLPNRHAPNVMKSKKHQPSREISGRAGVLISIFSFSILLGQFGLGHFSSVLEPL